MGLKPLSKEVIAAVRRYQRNLKQYAAKSARIQASDWDDAVLRQERIVITAHARDKALSHLAALLLADEPEVTDAEDVS